MEKDNYLNEYVDAYVENLKNFIDEMKEHPEIKILTSWGDLDALKEYNKKSLVFNTRLNFKPWVIVFCENENDVTIAFNATIDNNLPIRVRAGGHDHEGECTGTDTILLDISGMDGYDLDADGIAKIGPGNRFVDLTSKLAKDDVMIAHGTCATVGISGYTMGGGWGPWTRMHGMGCERLIGARILLGKGYKNEGEGKVIEVKMGKNGEIPPLLWALRGGGGMSYGIVTEFTFQTFELPCELHRFDLQWNPYKDSDPDYVIENVPTIDVLRQWESVINLAETKNLTGTNLKINAIPELSKNNDNTFYHNCTMYGYWNGDKESLNKFITKHFTGMETPVNIELATGSCYDVKKDYGKNLMGSWDRESHQEVLLKMGLLKGTPLQPDYDKPAPHKITSRLVDKDGLNHNEKNGHEELLESLCSPLVMKGNRELGLFQYATLGAIRGKFYIDNPDPNNERTAFPYSESQYTIQYQCWWNEDKNEKSKGQDNEVYVRTNRALDWMERSRDAKISNTSGAFISFKDNSIPTETYFGDSYKRLKDVKNNDSNDPENHFRSRKTII